ncbi:ATP-binding cassette domain-containing protein [Actinomadura yumaensis]|uniref:ATP-binding cassette domain-containing protein n=1 Tax=Actinomadura yumaensis TaxID=111807 RepID=A0ABW2CIY1_9ACTN
MIDVEGLTKRYGDKTVVDRATFTVRPGRVTGFLGPNGAGKSTTMRMMLGLDHPTAGTVAVNGRRYRDLAAPLCEVGALIDAKAVHGGRSAYDHLRFLARSNGIGRRRVDEVLETVGLRDAARKAPKGFSLGMGQRLGIAAALLGDPGILLFDEPVNGLDPDGILWIRTLMRQLAAEGRAVFVSSHLMSEMALTADHLVVIGRGRILADTGMNEFIDANAAGHVHVVSPEQDRLNRLLAGRRLRLRPDPEGGVRVYGATAEQIGELTAAEGLRLHQLATVRPSLEEAFMRLTGDSVEYHAGPANPASAQHPNAQHPSAQPPDGARRPNDTRVSEVRT